MRRWMTLAVAAAIAMSIPGTAGAEESPLEWIGEATFPTGFLFENVEVGGLSSISYDAAGGIYYTISDDRSSIAPARFYTVAVDLSDGSLDDGDVTFLTQTTLLNEDGVPYEAFSLDPEGIAFTGNSVFVSSEGDANALIDPFVNEYLLDGTFRRQLPVPPNYLPTADMSEGIRQNLSFESLTMTPNGRLLATANEAAMYQDGSAATLTESSPARILLYWAELGIPNRQFVYEVGPIPDEPIPSDAFAVNGLVELLALDNRGTMLAMERAFSVGVGNSVSIYLIDLREGDNVRRLRALEGVETPVSKDLVLDLGTLGITLDNLEGMTLGPVLPDGRQSLVLVSDNNFNPAGQFTQFLAFAMNVAAGDE